MTAPRIVILDQDGAHRAQCCDLLRAAGFEPVIVWEPSQLAAMAEQESAVAALLEAEAGHNGASVFEELRRQGIPCLGMSSTWLGGTNRALGISWDGCAEFWEKPVPQDDLLLWLKRLFPEVRPQPEGITHRSGGPVTAENPAAPDYEPTFNVHASPTARVDSPASRSDEYSTPPASVTAVVSEASLRQLDELARLREAKVQVTAPVAAAPERSADATPASGTPGVSSPLHVPPHLNVHRVPGSGDFSETAFATILARLAYDRSTGALMMQRDDDKKLAYLQDGFTVGVKTNMPDDTLTEMLVSQGLITLAQRRQADALAQEQRVTASHALIELGFFSAEDMETLVSTHIRNRLMDVFEWESGVFTFRDGPIPRGYNHEPVVSPMDFIWQGVQFSLPIDYAETAFAACMNLKMGWMSDPPSSDDMPMTLSQQQFLDSVSAGETMGQLQRAGRMKEPVWRIAYVLAATGFLGFQR